jgi:hypothetical protein
MSRLTSKEVKNIMEAYGAMYAPQELTEEQVWEEVENWVNSLLEEGYDLSEYTWEEMYESYIEEQGGVRPTVSRLRAGGPGREAPKPAPSMSYTQRMQMRRDIKNRGRSTTQSTTTPAAPRPAAAPAAAPRPAAPAAAAPRPAAPAARPAAPAARPAAPAARPAAAPKPAAETPTSTAAKPASTSDSPPKQSTASMVSDIRAMRARSLERQGKTGASAAVSATTKPAFKEENFDSFDVVIGHLLDEGYADTEESALAIMANMSEEWRNSIVEETLTEKLKKGTKGVQFGSGRHSGGWEQAMTEKNPKTGRQRATSPMYKAMGAHGKARSAQAKAESDGDFPRAEKNRKRREKIAATVYRKTGKIIDRADND